MSQENVTTTKDTIWESLALHWASEHLEFCIMDVDADHFPFCEKLCSHYRYKMKLRVEDSRTMLVFDPKPPAKK